jgi:uncharacterized protein YgfB (UPF0149 family)
MSDESNTGLFPAYQTFVESIAVLDLPISSSELHGVMCGYLCGGASHEGEMYLRALVVKKKKDRVLQAAVLSLFELYGISKQYIANVDFEFQLLLPDDSAPLAERAQAFGEWCEGFTQGITLAGISYEALEEDESQEALQHLFEFAQLDYETLSIDEDDEQSLMEVSEYARMAILRLCGDIQASGSGHKWSDTAH